MTSYSNPWAGKPVDTISDLLPRPNGQTCDECGSPCIDNCIMCGAPQCCPSCCYEDSPSARITGDKDRENPVEGAPPTTTSAVGELVWVYPKSLDDMPKKPGKEAYEYVECLVIYKGDVLTRPWNCEHQVFDDEAHDDFFCEWNAISAYIDLTATIKRYGAKP